MRRGGIILSLMAIWTLAAEAANAERTVVLVTSASCPVSNIESLDVRKVYLGVAVSIDDSHIRPFRVNGDDQLDRIFFQSIVAMSRKSYERRALSLALKFGTPRPTIFDNLDDALDAIRRIECSIVYAWADEVADEPGIKILKPLWHGL